MNFRNASVIAPSIVWSQILENYLNFISGSWRDLEMKSFVDRNLWRLSSIRYEKNYSVLITLKSKYVILLTVLIERHLVNTDILFEPFSLHGFCFGFVYLEADI